VEVQGASPMVWIVLAILKAFAMVQRLRPSTRGDARPVLQHSGEADRSEDKPPGTQEVGVRMGAQEGERIGRGCLCYWARRVWYYPEGASMTRLPYPTAEMIPDLTPDEFRLLDAAGQIVRREAWEEAST